MVFFGMWKYSSTTVITVQMHLQWGEAVDSVCVGAEGLTGCVNKGSLPLELMAIDQPRHRNDSSYLAQRLAI